MRDIYPVTIIATRYGGVYEGGQYAAFACATELVPPEAEGDDTDAMVFWRDADPRLVGVGATPDAALAALKANLTRVPFAGAYCTCGGATVCLGDDWACVKCGLHGGVSAVGGGR